MLTVFKNVRVITPVQIMDAMVVVDGARILGVHQHLDLPQGAAVIDGAGRYLSPGFVDIHVHGGGGFSVMSGSAQDVCGMAAAHGLFGTTSLVPTTLAAPIARLCDAIDGVREAAAICKSANILGIHLEGPFLAPSQRGAQSPDSILIPSEHDYIPLLERWDKLLMMGAAPEVPGALMLGRALAKRGVVASVAHSDASYEQVQAAMEQGYSDVTHIYSGCSTVTRKDGYRTAGVVEAGLALDGLTVQMIGDLRHLPVSLLRLIYQCKGADKISLITDGLECSASALCEGTVYTQENGVETIYEDGVMKLMNRQAFAGSVATCNVLVRNLYREAGISLCDAVRMASLTPATVVGFGHCKGRIASGYDADLLLYGEDIVPALVMVGGCIIHSALSPQ